MGVLIQIAFWMLLSDCLLPRSQPIADFGVEHMKNQVKCPPDSRFYAPRRSVAEACIPTALDCVSRELSGTVKAECADPEDYTTDAIEFLDRLIDEWKERGQAPTDSHECACEGQPEVSYSVFLNKALALIQRINSSR
ncbi:uncharacterized protein AB9W97_007020 [Spinachia spinachia]